jgi:hypothetical protein
MLQPTWIPLLKQDIRKLPLPAEKRQRKSATTTGSTSLLSPGQTSTSITSATSPYPASTSTSELIDPPSLRDFRKKRKTYSEPDYLEVPEPQRYWNEYDNPESGDEGGYYIYIDPNASVKFPGQEVLEAWVAKTRQLLHLGKSEESRLMSATEVGSSDDETVDTYVNASSPSYGTMNSSELGGYWSSLFRPRSGQNGDVEALTTVRRRSERERLSLLGEIQRRQHEREVTVFQLYASCLGAAVVLDIVLAILTSTSRRKLRGEVDKVVVFGVVFNFLLLLVALTSMMSRKERLGWLHWSSVVLVAVAMAIADALLLRWAL